MTDTYRHKGLRRQMVDRLREKGIQDERVLEAMESLPRHYFLDKTFEEWAYQDKPFPIGNEQTISQPYTVAYMTALLELQRRDTVLEVGTGSGYQAAVLALLGARVFTVERHELLFRRAQALLHQIGLGNVRCFLRDGYRGLPEYAPFNRIIVTAGAEQIPEALLQQLSIGGRMIIPVGKKVQRMLCITRHSADDYEETPLGRFRFVPFQEGINEM